MNPRFGIIMTAVALLSTVCVGGIRTAGKYSGVVIFDRWGGCTLHRGIYLMYISELVKEQLRPLAGKCVQVDATEVIQPWNPGDGRIMKLTVLDPDFTAKAWASPEGLKIVVASAFDDVHGPEFVIRVENIGEKPATLHMYSLAPTLLATQGIGGNPFSPSDGPSIAVITRQSFWDDHPDGPRMNGGNGTWRWTVAAPRNLQRSVTLDPKAAFEIRVAFKLPSGEYDFLVGYGGGVHEGHCIASNLIAFDVKEDGTVALAKAAGR